MTDEIELPDTPELDEPGEGGVDGETLATGDQPRDGDIGKYEDPEEWLSLRWFHQCVAIVRNQRYRCNRCQLEFSLDEAIRHAVENQSDMTSEKP